MDEPVGGGTEYSQIQRVAPPDSRYNQVRSFLGGEFQDFTVWLAQTHLQMQASRGERGWRYPRDLVLFSA